MAEHPNFTDIKAYLRRLRDRQIADDLVYVESEENGRRTGSREEASILEPPDIEEKGIQNANDHRSK